nr:hypothetical protein [uncultured organism]
MKCARRSGRKAPRPSRRRWTWSARSDPHSTRSARATRVGRGFFHHDRTARRASPPAGRPALPVNRSTRYPKETSHVGCHPQDPACRLPGEAPATDRTGRRAGRFRRFARVGRAARRDRHAVAEDHPPQRRGRAPAFVRNPPQRQRRCRGLRRHSAWSRIHFAGAGPAAGRRPSGEDRRRAGRAGARAGWRVPFRNLHVAALPELPGHGAGAERDERAQPAHPPRRHRRRAVPAGGRGKADSLGAHGLHERR